MHLPSCLEQLAWTLPLLFPLLPGLLELFLGFGSAGNRSVQACLVRITELVAIVSDVAFELGVGGQLALVQFAPV